MPLRSVFKWQDGGRVGSCGGAFWVGTVTVGSDLFSYLGDCGGGAFVSSLVTNVVINVMTLPLTVTFNVTSNIAPRGNVVATVMTNLVVSVFNKDGIRVNKPAKTFVIVVCNVVRGCKFRKLAVTALVTNLFLILFNLLQLNAVVGCVPCPVIMNFADNVTMAVFAARVGSLFNLALTSGPSSFLRG